jgi:hypothetical protein
VQILPALSKRALRLRQRHAHVQRVVLRTVGRRPPGAAGGLQSGSPGEKLALGSNPIAQLAPSPEDRLVRYLCVSLAIFGRGGDE